MSYSSDKTIYQLDTAATLDGTELVPTAKTGEEAKMCTTLDVANTILLAPIDFNQANAISSGWGNIQLLIESPGSESGISFKNNGAGGLQWNIISTSNASGTGGGNFSIGDATNSHEYIRINGNDSQILFNTPASTAANFAVASGGAEFQLDSAGGYFVMNKEGLANTEIINVDVADKYIKFDEHAQGYSISIGGPTPDTSALLDLTSTTQGLLLPRMTKIQRNTIWAVAGLAIYQIDNTPGLRIYNGSHWIRYGEFNDD